MPLINIVYPHTRRNGFALHKDNVSIILSALPVNECDMYVYQDAFSYFGEMPGLEVLLTLEPTVVLPGEYTDDVFDFFDYVVTFADSLAERGGKFRKINFPAFPVYDDRGSGQLIETNITRPLAERQNAICLINGNKSSPIEGELYSKRIEMAQWFHGHSGIPFHVYGYPPFDLPNYRGQVPMSQKFNTMAQYRYSLCFENIYHAEWSRGYVSEKIIHSFMTETVPVYFGCYNIEEYIPTECFIDFRQFADYADLDNFLQNLTDARYQAIVNNIRDWVRAGNMSAYSADRLHETLADLIEPGWTDAHNPDDPWLEGLTPRHARYQLTYSRRDPMWRWQDLAPKQPAPTVQKTVEPAPTAPYIQGGWLSQHTRNITSQHGEDGVIAKIFEVIGKKNRWCVEFGAWDGKHLSNTWTLIQQQNWSAVLIEGDEERAERLIASYANRPDVFAMQGWISDQTPLDSLLAKTPIPKDFDLLSVDIDGDDYWVWQASTAYRPRVVVVETNPTFGPDIHFIPQKGNHFGASMRAMVELGQDKGYELVAYTNINCIFVVKEEFKKLDITDNSCEALFKSMYIPKVVADLDGNHYLVQPGPWGFKNLQSLDDLRRVAHSGPVIRA